MIAGGVLALVGGLAFLASFMVDRIDQAVSRVVYGDLESRYVCTPAQPSDLIGLHALYARFFGEDVPDIQTMHQWLTKCSTAFTVVHKVVANAGLSMHQELVGSFKVLPLTVRGARAVELGQVTGSTFRSEHICTVHAKAAGYWVGDLVATARFARGIVMAQLNAAVAPALRGSVTVYARPLTKDGLRVMAKHGFVQTGDGKSAPEIGRTCKLQVVLGSEAAVSPPRPRRRRLTPVLQAASA